MDKLLAKEKEDNASRVASLQDILELNKTITDDPNTEPSQKAKRHTAPNPVGNLNSEERENTDKRHQSLPVKNQCNKKNRECRNSFADLLAPNPRVSFVLGSRDSVAQMKDDKSDLRVGSPPTSPPHMPLPPRPGSYF